ncbi:unnamed protein product [Durusdinium trenchii]|uniref:Uncharacterized protein n=1 Tax=Durusdinium trenchii TaxID=1381693 RepID=A0ABP0LPX0_9DINO
MFPEALTQHIHAPKFVAELSFSVSLALRRYQEKLQQLRGRLIAQHSVCLLFVFTDAFFELPGVPKLPKADVGGMLFSEHAELVSWFSWQLPSSMLVDFIDAGAKTLIFELEFLAVLLAIECWHWRLTLGEVRGVMESLPQTLKFLIETLSAGLVPLLAVFLRVISAMLWHLFVLISATVCVLSWAAETECKTATSSKSSGLLQVMTRTGSEVEVSHQLRVRWIQKMQKDPDLLVKAAKQVGIDLPHLSVLNTWNASSFVDLTSPSPTLSDVEQKLDNEITSDTDYSNVANGATKAIASFFSKLATGTDVQLQDALGAAWEGGGSDLLIAGVALINPAVAILATFSLPFMSLLTGGPESSPYQDLYNTVMKEVKVLIVTAGLKRAQAQMQILANDLEVLPGFLSRKYTTPTDVEKSIRLSFFLTLQYQMGLVQADLFQECYTGSTESYDCKTVGMRCTVFPALAHAQLHMAIFTELMAAMPEYRSQFEKQAKAQARTYFRICLRMYEYCRSDGNDRPWAQTRADEVQEKTYEQLTWLAGLYGETPDLMHLQRMIFLPDRDVSSFTSQSAGWVDSQSGHLLRGFYVKDGGGSHTDQITKYREVSFPSSYSSGDMKLLDVTLRNHCERQSVPSRSGQGYRTVCYDTRYLRCPAGWFVYGLYRKHSGITGLTRVDCRRPKSAEKTHLNCEELYLSALDSGTVNSWMECPEHKLITELVIDDWEAFLAWNRDGMDRLNRMTCCDVKW